MTAPPPSTHSVDAPARPASGSRRWAGLDGLRGILAIVVLAYHGGARDVLPGGILSMDVFFVLSGFLITGLLLTETERTGTVALRRFWVRRFRRLLPALLLLLLVVPLVWRLVSDPVQLGRLRGDTFATLGYVANWHSIASGSSYFDSVSAPSPLLHMWSLGVEEQFYLLWPLVVLLVLRLGRRRSPQFARRLLLAVCVVGALVSAATATLLSLGGASSSRLYYGTDVRSQALLIGAALAVVLHGRTVGAAGRRLAAWGGLAAAAVMAVAAFRVDGEDPGLYRGGMLAFALCAGLVCAALVLAPDAPGARLLGLWPLAALGRISYGVYLWHWPVDLLLDPQRTGLRGAELFAVRSAAAVAIAAVSYQLVELPMRRGGVVVRAWRRSGRVVPRRAVVLATLVSVITVTATTAAALPAAPTINAAYSDVVPGTVPDATVQVSGAANGPAAAGLPPVPTVLYYGDSIGYEAGGAFADILAASGRVKVEFRAFPATAVCDWLPDMRTRVAREKPKAVVVSFLGLGYPKCMHDASGRSPQGSALVRRTVADDRTALQVLTSTGATVYWNSTPASWTLPDQDRLTAAVKQLVSTTPHAQWIDAGDAVAPGNRWTRYLPCLPGEPCRPDGTAQVRGPDIMHFCPRGKTWMDSVPRGRCPVWASGAWRYALAQAMPVLRQLDLKAPDKPIVSTAHGTRLT